MGISHPFPAQATDHTINTLRYADRVKEKQPHAIVPLADRNGYDAKGGDDNAPHRPLSARAPLAGDAKGERGGGAPSQHALRAEENAAAPRAAPDPNRRRSAPGARADGGRSSLAPPRRSLASAAALRSDSGWTAWGCFSLTRSA